MSEWSSFTTHKVVRCVPIMVHTYHQLKCQLILNMPTLESVERCTSKRMRTGGDKLTTSIVSFRTRRRKSIDYRGKSISWSSSSRIPRATTEDARANARVTNTHSSPAMDPIEMLRQQAGRPWCPTLGLLHHTHRQWRRTLQNSRTCTCLDLKRQVTRLFHHPLHRWQCHRLYQP